MTNTKSRAYTLNKQAADVDRSKIELVSRTVFYLHQQPESVRMCFYYPKLLYWSGAYLIQRMRYGILTDNANTQYQVVFFNDLTRGEVLAKQDEQYALSFREPKETLQLPNIVLIRKAG